MIHPLPFVFGQSKTMTSLDYSIPDDKTIIGLTGNIATGKSAVMRLAAGTVFANQCTGEDRKSVV